MSGYGFGSIFQQNKMGAEPNLKKLPDISSMGDGNQLTIKSRIGEGVTFSNKKGGGSQGTK